MAEKRRLYEFSWDFIGDIELGRPNLGNSTRIEVYRLFQYTLRDVLEARYGTEEADRILYDAGFLAGRNFCDKLIDKEESLETFLDKVQQTFRDLGVCILRIERSDIENYLFTMTLDEDLDCSGLPEMDQTVCNYDEGFLAGIFYAYNGISVDVKEVDCWCTNDRICRFEVKAKSQE